jgi:hyaluronoglucosaminidase
MERGRPPRRCGVRPRLTTPITVTTLMTMTPPGTPAPTSPPPPPSPSPSPATKRVPLRTSAAVVAAALVVTTPLLAACTSPPAGSASTRDVAWVATDASVTLPGSNVTPVDVVTRKIGPKVPVGILPTAFAYTAGDRGLLVVTQGNDTLSEIDPATHDVVHSTTVGVEPDAVAVAPGGTGNHGIAFVTNLDSNSVTPVDLGTWRAGKPIAVGHEPVAVVVSVDSDGSDGSDGSGGATAFVADFGSNQVTPIDVSTLQAGAPIAVGPGPQTVAVSAGQVLVGNFSNSTVTPINASTLQPGKAVPIPLNPTAMAVAPSGATTYVCGGAGVVPVTVNALGLAVGAVIALPDAAQGIALTADGSVAWVTQQAGSVVPVTLATAKVGKPLHLGGHPSAIVIGAG